MSEAPDRAGPTLLTTANTPQSILSGTAVGWLIVRDITVVNELSQAVHITLGFNTSATDAAGKRITPPAMTLEPGEMYEWTGFKPMASSSDELYAMCDTNNGATITVGYVSGP